MIQTDKWFPSYGDKFDFIAIIDNSPEIRTVPSMGVDDDPRIEQSAAW